MFLSTAAIVFGLSYVTFNTSVALAWQTDSACVNNQWVLTGPVADWSANTTFTFTFDNGSVQSAAKSVSVTAPAAANSVVVSYSDSEETDSYTRPEGCKATSTASATFTPSCEEAEGGYSALVKVDVTVVGPDTGKPFVIDVGGEVFDIPWASKTYFPGLTGIPGSKVTVALKLDGVVLSSQEVTTPCAPVIYNPTITARGVCIDKARATITGNTSGFPEGSVLVSANIGDLDYGSSTVAANGPFTIKADLSPTYPEGRTGNQGFLIFAEQGAYTASVQINVDFSKCQPVVETTVPPTVPTTVPSKVPPTVPSTVPPTVPPTIPVITTPVVVIPTPTTPPTVPPPGLPATGTNNTVLAIIATFLVGFGCLMIMFTRRRPRLVTIFTDD